MKAKTIKFFLYLSIALLAISTIFHLLSYFPSLKTSNSFLMFVLVIGIIPTFMAAGKAVNKYVKNSDHKNLWKNVLKGAPTRIRKSVWIVFAYTIFNFFFSLLVLNKGLSPEIVDGKYVLENQGKVVEEISEEQYYKHKAYLFRGMSGHFILFQFFSMAMLSSAYRLESDDNEKSNTI